MILPFQVPTALNVMTVVSAQAILASDQQSLVLGLRAPAFQPSWGSEPPTSLCRAFLMLTERRFAKMPTKNKQLFLKPLGEP